MNEAENTGETQEGAETASGQGPQIPKWRLDEVTARLRAREEELESKNQLLNQFAPRNQAQPGMTAEELGLEPQTFQAVQRLANHMVQEKLKQVGAPLQHQMATMANSLEETQFLLNHGKDKAKYLDKVKEQRQRHYQMTNSYLSVENAYKLVMFDEMTRQTAPKTAAGTPVQGTIAVQETGGNSGPDAQQTRQNAGTQGGAAKPFEEMSIEEQEAHLEGQMGAGARA